MRTINFGSLIFVFLVVSCIGKSPEEKENQIDERPNIILIMSDDMGYSDISPYGSEINTPNLEYLAENGIKFTQFYNTARCCPTRASLLTGCYPHQTGIGHMTNPPNDPKGHDYGTPEYQGKLNNNTVTIAEVLKDAGYATMMSGKWHLGYHDREQWPLQRGFDQFYGFIPGAGNFFKPQHPRGITEGNDTITITDPDYYTTDAFTDKAIEFINKAKSKGGKNNPFFLYLAYNAPHWPIQAPKEDIERYRNRYKGGWSKLREERYERMKKMGLIAQEWKLSEGDAVAWESLTVDKQDEMALRMAIYAAMVDRMDQNIGRLLDSLKERDLFDNTVIMFLNDNGACAEGGMLGGGPAEQLETKEGYFLTYGKAWANASNTPYREYKHWVHEGGIATPFIVHWPKGIAKTARGETTETYAFLPDVMATCLELADAPYPEKFRENPIVPHSGKSIAEILKGRDTTVHTEPIFWEHEGNKAVRLGNYKLVQKWQQDKAPKWELYDMEKDRTEMNDIAMKQPDVRDKMIALYNDWAKRTKVLPWDEAYYIWKSKSKNH